MDTIGQSIGPDDNERGSIEGRHSVGTHATSIQFAISLRSVFKKKDEKRRLAHE